jgi:hypothetical protein
LGRLDLLIRSGMYDRSKLQDPKLRDQKEIMRNVEKKLRHTIEQIEKKNFKPRVPIVKSL